MTLISCASCEAKTVDALLCVPCAAQIEQALAEIPAAITNLRAVETRQASGPLGLGDPQRQWDAAPADGARPVTPWPYAPGAADQLWVIENELLAWTKHLTESRGLPLPEIPAGMSQSIALAAWLMRNIEAIRQDEAAGDVHDAFVNMAEDNRRAILGMPPRDEFYGVCDDRQLRPVVHVYAGPRCYGLTDCGHDSCRLIRGDETHLGVEVTMCGAQLHAADGDTHVTCDACGRVWSIAERQAMMRDGLGDQLLLLRDAATALTKLDEPVTVGMIDQAIRRGRLTGYGTPQRVKVSELRAWLEARRAKRRRMA